MAGASSGSFAKESEGGVDRQASQCGQKTVLGRRMGAKETLRYWLIGCKRVSSMSHRRRYRKAQALSLSRVVRG